MNPVLLALPEHERPLLGESATDYWLRLRSHPPAKRGPRLLTPATMTPFQKRQYEGRIRGGMDCADALEAVKHL